MAERRMFSKTIIDSDAFLDMPLSTQALYFHLSMRADDDGFLNNPKKIMRSIGAGQNELELLIAKKFILCFESGVIVVKHWRLHNYIQKDRYKQTVYTEELSKLKLKDNNVYSLDTECIQNGNTGKVSIELGKDRLGKDILSAEKSAKPKKRKFGNFQNILLTETEYKKLIEDFGDLKAHQWIEKVSEGIEMKGYKYKNHNLAIRSWMKKESEKPEIKQVKLNEATGWDTTIKKGW